MIVKAIPYKNFKEKIKITKKYDGIAKMVIGKEYIYMEIKDENIYENGCYSNFDICSYKTR